MSSVNSSGPAGEINTHTLRETFARLIYTALDYDLVRTSYAMRHASIGTNVQYLSFRKAEVDRAILGINCSQNIPGCGGIIEITTGNRRA